MTLLEISKPLVRPKKEFISDTFLPTKLGKTIMWAHI